MQAGLLNELIEIYKPELSRNDFGEQVQKYIRVRVTKAQVISDSGSRETSNNEIVYTYSKTFILRRYIELNENYQIKYDNKLYRILSIEDNRKYNNKRVITELVNE